VALFSVFFGEFVLLSSPGARSQLEEGCFFLAQRRLLGAPLQMAASGFFSLDVFLSLDGMGSSNGNSPRLSVMYFLLSRVFFLRSLEDFPEGGGCPREVEILFPSSTNLWFS